MIDFGGLERLLISRQFDELRARLNDLLPEDTRTTIARADFERLMALKLRLVIATDGAANGVALLHRTRFEHGRVPFELFMICFESFESADDRLRAFVLEQLKRTAVHMADDNVTQQTYELLRLDYERLLELCLFHVLLPQSKHAEARHLLQADTILSVEKKTFFASLMEELILESNATTANTSALRPTVLSFDDDIDTRQDMSSTSINSSSTRSVSTNKFKPRQPAEPRTESRLAPPTTPTSTTNTTRHSASITAHTISSRVRRWLSAVSLRHASRYAAYTLGIVVVLFWLRSRRRRAAVRQSLFDLIIRAFT